MTTHIESTALEQEGIDKAVSAADAASAAAVLQTPHERLVASREAIRNALVRHEPRSARKRRERQAQAAAAASAATRGEAPPKPAFTERMTDLFSQVPLSGLATRWLARWWQRNPWRSTIEFAVDAADEVARPVAQKHPWLLLGGAFAVGAALSRPSVWRRMTSVALMVGLIPRVNMSSIVQSMTSMAKGMMNEPGARPAARRNEEADDDTSSGASQHQSQGWHPTPGTDDEPSHGTSAPADGRTASSTAPRREAATEASH